VSDFFSFPHRFSINGINSIQINIYKYVIEKKEEKKNKTSPWIIKDRINAENPMDKYLQNYETEIRNLMIVSDKKKKFCKAVHIQIERYDKRNSGKYVFSFWVLFNKAKRGE
jgi:hypothetical protein